MPGWGTRVSSPQETSQELGQHWQGRIRPGLVQRTQENYGTEGHSWDLQRRVPVAGQPRGVMGKLPSCLGCHWEGGGQLEVLTRRLAGLSVPPALPSINGATQLRN